MLVVEVLKFLIEGLTLIWNGSAPSEWWHNWFALGAAIVGGVITFLSIRYIEYRISLKYYRKLTEIKRWKKTLLSLIILWVLAEIGYYIYQVDSWTPQSIFLVITMLFIELTIIFVS